MNDMLRSGDDMLEVTRLTRAGRLGQATVLLQRILRGTPPPPPIDQTGPVSFSGGNRRAAGDATKTAGSPLSSGLHALLDRVKGFGFETQAGFRQPVPDIVPDDGTFVAKSYRNEAGARAYKLYVPGSYQGQPLPLVVMLHGCTQSPDDFAAGTRMNAIAEELSCLVAYPAQPATANASKCWNWFRPGDQRRDAGEPSLIAGITWEIMSDYTVDPQRVYIAGLSAGAAAAAVMGTAYPDLYAAIGVHSGLACGAASDLRSAFTAMSQGGAPLRPRGDGSSWIGEGGRIVPTIVFHGDRDATVHPRNGDHVISQSKTTAELQASVHRGQVPGGRSYTRTVHADARGRAILEQWDIHGAGHAWSGGSTAGTFTDPRGPDASREMVRFFLAHSRDAT